jgi:hypothetical protein
MTGYPLRVSQREVLAPEAWRAFSRFSRRSKKGDRLPGDIFSRMQRRQEAVLPSKRLSSSSFHHKLFTSNEKAELMVVRLSVDENTPEFSVVTD